MTYFFNIGINNRECSASLVRNGTRYFLLAAAAVLAATAGHAQASERFTWTPGAVGLNGAAFTADALSFADYDTIVQVMDAARVRQTVEGAKVKREPLFPQIALGDAPT